MRLWKSPPSKRVRRRPLVVRRTDGNGSPGEAEHGNTTGFVLLIDGKSREVLSKLHRHSRQHRYVPVLVFLPTGKELRGRMRGTPSPFGEFVGDLMQRYAGSNLVVVDLREREFAEIDFNVRGTGSHLSPYGNEVVASAIHEAIDPLVEDLSAEPVQ